MRMMTLAILCVIAPQRADKGAKREGSQTILHADRRGEDDQAEEEKQQQGGIGRRVDGGRAGR
eukprot:490466-Rhodomonas_salina.1